MIRFRPFKDADARRKQANRIKLHAKLAREIGRKLRVSIPAASKPANLRSAAR